MPSNGQRDDASRQIARAAMSQVVLAYGVRCGDCSMEAHQELFTIPFSPLSSSPRVFCSRRRLALAFCSRSSRQSRPAEIEGPPGPWPLLAKVLASITELARGGGGGGGNVGAVRVEVQGCDSVPLILWVKRGYS